MRLKILNGVVTILPSSKFDRQVHKHERDGVVIYNFTSSPAGLDVAEVMSEYELMPKAAE